MEKFKKARVIMLPTERGILVKRNTTNELKFSGLNNPLLWIPQSLYIVSNDKIKEGDYYLFFKNNSICKAEFLTEENIEVLEGLRKIKAVQKIIASTDTLLIEDKRTYICGLMDKPNILPQPSQQFIEKYIESYNKGEIITDVLVEYEGYECEDNHYMSYQTICVYPCCDKQNYPKLKVNTNDNTITIKKLKDSWNREEIDFELNRLLNEILISKRNLSLIGKPDSNKICAFLNKWIKENL